MFFLIWLDINMTNLELNDINEFYKKDGIFKNLYKFSMINYPYIIVQIISVIIINAYTDNNLFLSFFSLIFIQFWSYISHMYAHSTYIPSFMKMHDLHHNSAISNQPYYILIEFYINIMFAGGFILIIYNLFFQRFFGNQYKIFNYYIILSWCLIYSSYHLINYHFLSIKTHENHHEYIGTTNFSPDWWDIIFETKIEKDAIENTNSSIINIIIVTILILWLKSLGNYDPIKILTEIIIKKNTVKITCNDENCNIKLK